MLSHMEAPAARLARYVRARRHALRITQRQAAIKADLSNQTWVAVERGDTVSERTLIGVDVGLNWQAGSAARILEGGDPPEEMPGGPPERTLDERLERVEQLLEQLLAEKEAEEAQRAAEPEPNR